MILDMYVDSVLGLRELTQIYVYGDVRNRANFLEHS